MSNRHSIKAAASAAGHMGLDLDEWSDDDNVEAGGGAGNDEDSIEQGRPLSPSKRPQGSLNEGGGPIVVSMADAEEDGFDVKERRPDDWMEVKDTIGLRYLAFVLGAQVLGTVCGMAYVSAAYEDLLSWKMSCWGVWNNVEGTNGVDIITWKTRVGWKGFGTVAGFGIMSDISPMTTNIGTAAAAMSTFTVLFGVAFSIWTLTVLYKSRGRRGAEEEATAARLGDTGDGTTCTTCCHRMELAVRSHTLLRAMGAWMIFAGLWLLCTGVLAYYGSIMTGFTEGLSEIIESKGSNVQCNAPLTLPRYGYIMNGVNVLAQLGAGGFIYMKVLAARRELTEACELWERDQEEMAALQSKKGHSAPSVTGGNGSSAHSSIAKGSAQQRLSVSKSTPLPSPSTRAASPATNMNTSGSSSSRAAVTPLPSGWERESGANGAKMYVNHSKMEVTCVTPR